MMSNLLYPNSPIMGWSSAYLGCDVTQQHVEAAVDQLKSTGLKDKGFNFIHLDCWADPVRQDGKHLQADTKRFTKEMAELKKQLEDDGFKLSLTLSAGVQGCDGDTPGSYGFEEEDADRVARIFEAHYVKYVNCFNPGIEPAKDRFSQMRDLLNEKASLVGEDQKVFYSVSNWGSEGIASWGNEVAGAWTLSPDSRSVYSKIQPNDWQYMKSSFLAGIEGASGIKEGQYIDLGPLAIPSKKPTLTQMDEIESNIALWAMARTPIFLSMDMAKLDERIPALFDDTIFTKLLADPYFRPIECLQGCYTFQDTIGVYGNLIQDQQTKTVYQALTAVNWDPEVPTNFLFFASEDWGYNPDDKCTRYSRFSENEQWEDFTASQQLAVTLQPHGSYTMYFKCLPF